MSGSQPTATCPSFYLGCGDHLAQSQTVLGQKHAQDEEQNARNHRPQCVWVPVHITLRLPNVGHEPCCKQVKKIRRHHSPETLWTRPNAGHCLVTAGGHCLTHTYQANQKRQIEEYPAADEPFPLHRPVRLVDLFRKVQDDQRKSGKLQNRMIMRGIVS